MNELAVVSPSLKWAGEPGRFEETAPRPTASMMPPPTAREGNELPAEAKGGLARVVVWYDSAATLGAVPTSLSDDDTGDTSGAMSPAGTSDHTAIHVMVTAPRGTSVATFDDISRQEPSGRVAIRLDVPYDLDTAGVQLVRILVSDPTSRRVLSFLHANEHMAVQRSGIAYSLGQDDALLDAALTRLVQFGAVECLDLGGKIFYRLDGNVAGSAVSNRLLAWFDHWSTLLAWLDNVQA